MKIDITIPDYAPPRGIQLEWEEGFIIETAPQGRGFIIRANRDGLISLARHMLTLAQETVPVGWHIHLDDVGALEDGSCELTIEKR